MRRFGRGLGRGAVRPSDGQPNTRPVFRDPQLEGRFRARGAVVAPFLEAAALASLEAELAELDLFGVTGFHDTASVGLDYDARARLHHVVSSAFADAAAALLADYRPVTSSLLTKWPGQEGTKEIHRDFRLVDEERFRSVCIWVPFVDVDEGNGALAVLPGSHDVSTGPRTVPRTPSVPADPIPQLDFSDLEVLPCRAGDAVVFDMAVVHGSAANQSSSPRPAAALAFAPVAAEMSLLFCHPDDRIEELEVIDPDVFRRITWDQPPSELRSLGTVTARGSEVSRAELLVRSRQRAGAARG